EKVMERMQVKPARLQPQNEAEECAGRENNPACCLPDSGERNTHSRPQKGSQLHWKKEFLIMPGAENQQLDPNHGGQIAPIAYVVGFENGQDETAQENDRGERDSNPPAVQAISFQVAAPERLSNRSELK